MTARAPRVAIKTLGCKVNRTESEALAESLLGAAIAIVDDPEQADLIVVNTCTVTGEADAKARKEIRRALLATAGPVVVAGCLARMDPDGLRGLGGRVVVEGDRDRLRERVGALLGSTLDGAAPVAPVRSGGEAFRTRVMLKVQDGCDHRCSYCIVPDARGVPRSVHAAEVLERAALLERAGTPEVVLTGINIGRYADADAGVADLADLLTRIAVSGDFRVRVSSIDPLDLTERFAGALAALGERVAPHLHVPLQSGCDRTLAEMRRGYTTAQFAERLELVRAARPEVAITTDVIVGFPGETDDDLAASLAFAQRCGFARLHVFRYSRRAGTPAAARVDQVDPATIARRAAAMRALSDRLEASWLRARDGSHASVLVERDGMNGASGTSEDGIRVLMPAGSAQPGRIVSVELRLGADGRMRGVPEGGNT